MELIDGSYNIFTPKIVCFRVPKKNGTCVSWKGGQKCVLLEREMIWYTRTVDYSKFTVDRKWMIYWWWLLRSLCSHESEVSNIHYTVNTSVVGIELVYFIVIIYRIYCIHLRRFTSIHTRGGSDRGATRRGGRPRWGAVDGVKMNGPAWDLSLSTLIDSWRSPRSRMKNFGERETMANGPL